MEEGEKKMWQPPGAAFHECALGVWEDGAGDAS